MAARALDVCFAVFLSCEQEEDAEAVFLWYSVWDEDESTDLQYSILPALAFSLDMFAKTAMSFGVNEVLLASVLGSVVFSLFAAQPLVIVGVTGKETQTPSPQSETDGDPRSNYRLQLYRLRHNHTERHQLLCFHVLDWSVWPH